VELHATVAQADRLEGLQMRMVDGQQWLQKPVPLPVARNRRLHDNTLPGSGCRWWDLSTSVLGVDERTTVAP
jgi:hypothetical protein